MKTRSFTILFLLASICVGQELHALFLGNSYTYFNNMPQIVKDIATSVGDTFSYDTNLPGGYTLQGHSTNTVSQSKIAQGNWDFVVLQEQSQRPSFPISQVQQDVYPYAERLNDSILKYSPCGETMFFMTWGRKNGDASNCASWPPVCTYEGMDSLLSLRYMEMADMNTAEVSPVGAVWKYIRANHPGIELYATDGSHPSAEGSYAAACSFYTAMFRKDVSSSTFNFTISASDASLIRAAVKKVVLDSLANWNILDTHLTSSFVSNQISKYQFQFTSTSQHATAWKWNIDGNAYSQENPSHTFPGAGTYAISLWTYDGCDSAYSEEVLSFIPEGIHTITKDVLSACYPNPGSTTITIDLSLLDGLDRLIIWNESGQLMTEMSIKNATLTKIDVRGYETGNYFYQLFRSSTMIEASRFTVNH